MTPAIDTTALTKRFRRLDTLRDVLAYPWRQADVLAVDAVSLRVERGELFGLLGPNGAGKTTLIRMLSTALLPSAGSARVAGHDVVRDVRAVRRSIALVGCDHRSFFPRLSGRANLEFFAALGQVHGAPARRRIDELLERTGLGAGADRPFRTYSSGMRQKLAFARGLLGEPDVLFLDEPSRSLDPISAREVRSLISEYLIGELGRTVILATHSLSEAEQMCDRMALIRYGRIVGAGTVDELRRTLPHGVRCELRLDGVPAGLLHALRHRPGVLDVAADADEPDVVRLTLRDGGAVVDGVLREVIEHDAEIHACTTREGVAGGDLRRLARRGAGAHPGGAVLARMALPWAFLRRDLRIEASYKAALALRVVAAALSVLVFYFIAVALRGVGGSSFGPFGGYFDFAVIGLAFLAYLSAGVGAMASSLRESQAAGTLELLVISPTRLSLTLLSSSLSGFAFATLSVAIYLVAGAALGLDLSEANVAVAVLSFAVATVSFIALGLFAASIVFLTARGNPIAFGVRTVSLVLCGVMYPVAVLPDGLRALAQVLPLTPALELLRGSLLLGQGLNELWDELAILAAMGAVLLPASLLACRLAVRIARTDGSLTR